MCGEFKPSKRYLIILGCSAILGTFSLYYLTQTEGPHFAQLNTGSDIISEQAYVELKSWQIKIERLVNTSIELAADTKHAVEQDAVHRNASEGTNLTMHTTTTLSDTLFAFPWKSFEDSIVNHTSDERAYRQKLIDQLQIYAYQEPLVPTNNSCEPPPLLDPKDISCSDYPDAFLPNKYAAPVKVAHAIQLGFDADTLEIHLNELYDVVDYFFILEATKIHCKTLRFVLFFHLLLVNNMHIFIHILVVQYSNSYFVD